MTGGSFRLTVAVIVLCVLAPGLFAAAPDNEDVGRQIDQITEPPPYDWLRRQPGPAPDGVLEKKPGPGKKVEKTRARKGEGESSDCDFEPPASEPKKGPDEEVNLPKGSGGCDSGGAPGSPDVAPPVPDDPSTGCGPPPSWDCGFEPGDCGCGQTAGSCGCGGLSGVAGPFGVIMGAVALGLVIFLIVRAFMGRRRPDDSEIVTHDLEAPEDVRLSEVATIPAATMMDRARAAASTGDYKMAVGWAYLAGLSDLSSMGFTELDRSTTNWKIVESTRRAGGPYKEAGRLVRIFEDLFFGDRRPLEPHWLECRKIVEVDFVETSSDQS